MSKFDQANPLFCQHGAKENEDKGERSKEEKRSDKLTRDVIVKSVKDTNEVMETKMETVQTSINENINKGLQNDFKGNCTPNQSVN